MSSRERCATTEIRTPAMAAVATARRLLGCGNGIKDPNEVCDDGNTVNGDGCSADCRSNETCGNGVVDVIKGEVCDDGNTNSGDGCSADCKSHEKCGNGIQDKNEVCDDGNNTEGDGCSANALLTKPAEMALLTR